MDSVHEVINYINALPASTWTTLGAYLAGSTLVATILQIVKHKFNFADAQKLVVFALGFISFLVAFANFIISANPTLSALPYISRVTGLLMGGAVFMHRFAVSSAYYNLTTKLQGFNTLLKEAEEKESNGVSTVSATVTTNSAVTPSTVIASVLPDEANLAQFQV